MDEAGEIVEAVPAEYATPDDLPSSTLVRKPRWK